MGRTLKTAAIIALLAAAAAVSAAERRTSSTAESHTFDHQTNARKKFDLRVPADGARVRLRVKASARAGEIRIVVRDADGHVWQEAQLVPSKSRPGYYDVDSGEMKSEAGVWTVEIELKDAVGSYEFRWTVG